MEIERNNVTWERYWLLLVARSCTLRSLQLFVIWLKVQQTQKPHLPGNDSH